MENNLQKHINREFKEAILNHEKRLEIANGEMAEVKLTQQKHSDFFALLESKITNVENAVRSLSAKEWFIIGLIIAAAIAVLFKTK